MENPPTDEPKPEREPETPIVDLGRHRLRTEMNGLKGLGSAIASAIDNQLSDGDEILKELHRRGLPVDIDLRLLVWPQSGITTGSALLLRAGLDPRRLPEALKIFVDGFYMSNMDANAETMIDDDNDVENPFTRLDIVCDCNSVKCDRSYLATSQITSAFLSACAAVDAMLPEFYAPPMSKPDPSTEETEAYINAVQTLRDHHRETSKQLVGSIMELMLIIQLKGGLIQLMASD